MKTDAGLLQFLQGGGDTGALIRAKNWADTPLGPIEGWPQSLKTTLGILLNSRYPMFVFWGPQLIKIYNDGYRPILGGKHPHALGKPAREVWPEIWSDIEPLVARALNGDPTWSDDLMLFIERNGFPEESYFTFSYSPVTDESGGVGGMFCAVIETTAQVLGERRLRTLRDLAAALADTTTERDVCVKSADLLHANAADAPFVLIYLLDSDDSAILAAQAGVMTGNPVAPAVIGQGEASWPIHEAIEKRSDRLVTDLRSRFADVPRAVARASRCGHGAAVDRSRPRSRDWRDRARHQRPPSLRCGLSGLVRPGRRPGQRRRSPTRAPSRRNASAPRPSPSSTAPRPPSSATSATSSARRSR